MQMKTSSKESSIDSTKEMGCSGGRAGLVQKAGPPSNMWHKTWSLRMSLFSVMEILNVGRANRRPGAPTHASQLPSRSHAILVPTRAPP